MRRLIFDTCFWFALYDPNDSWHSLASKMISEFESGDLKIIIPFPSLYETLNTEFVSNKKQLAAFKEALNNRSKIEYVFDEPYKDEACSMTFDQDNDKKASLVDNVILLMLGDKSLNIDAVVTFNGRDFAEPCRNYGKEMICYSLK